jgi:lipopolysaccharide/colanic/teichoic acid biosynthesis glycosyltransferase
MLAIAAAVRLSTPGPALYAQERMGYGRRSFRLFKFRTMYVDAEERTGPVWSWAGDPRVTPLGRVLRATHLDELPQLWNVLRGQMSLVGPRPERAHFVEKIEAAIPGYAERFDVLPGITGWGQLRSGYDSTMQTVRRKTRYDRIYVRRACALLDARILLETFLRVSAISRRDLLGSWSESVPPPSDAANVLARGNSHRFGTGTPGSVAAGQA